MAETTTKETTMTGTCMTCGKDAEATFSNEGYSDCCNDRIAYGDEAEQVKRRNRVEEAEEAGLPRVEIIGSWGQVEREGFLLRETEYRGQGGCAIVLDDSGYEGLHLPGQWKIA